MLSRRRSFARALVAAAIALPLFGLAGRPADACGNSVRVEVDATTPQVARAEKALNEGQHTLAAVGVIQVFPGIRGATPGAGPLQDRALRVMALAVARADGALTAGKHWRGTTPDERRANLQWATDTLRALSKLRKDNPAARTDLAEVLAKHEGHRDEAKKILDELAGKDLITSPHGYRTLAALRAAAGDTAGRDAAVKRCEAMAKAPGVCRLGPPPAGDARS